MMYEFKKWISFTIIVFILIECIGQNKSNDSILLNLIYKVNQKEDIYLSNSYNSCIVSADTSNGRMSVCFQLKEVDCSLNYFNSLSTPAILQKRKDDLTFISLNYANCASSVATLGGKYNTMTTPASMVLKDFLQINGNSDPKTISFSSVESCSTVGLFASKYVPGNFSSLLDRIGLLAIDSLESELAIILTTTNACLADLSFQPAFLPTIQSLRDGSIQRGIVCSHTPVPGYQVCPWLE
jgi:hypothetical protein